MKLTVAAIGRMKAGSMAELADQYAGRIRQTGKNAGIPTLTITEFAESRKQSAEARCAEEATQLLSCCPENAPLIALDERGKAITSEELATLIRSYLENGVSDLVFAIGGPDGHGPEIRQKASHTLCLGKMTWPHMLARVLLLEQVYRVVTILLNHPYHRQ